MTRSFIIPIVRLLDKCFEYVKGRGDQYLARARGKHPVRKGKEESVQAVLTITVTVTSGWIHAQMTTYCEKWQKVIHKYFQW